MKAESIGMEKRPKTETRSENENKVVNIISGMKEKSTYFNC